jgi:CRP-like cAMP-binding protein
MRWTRSAGQDAKIERLRRVPLLRPCRAEELRKLAASGELATSPAGTVLHNAGEDVGWLHLVLDGELAVRTPGGGEQPRDAGAVVGDKEVLSGHAATGTAVTMTEMTTLVMGRREFLAAMDTCPSFRGAVVSSLAERLVSSTESVTNLAGAVYRLPVAGAVRRSRTARRRGPRVNPRPASAASHPAGVARRLVPTS